MKWKTPRYAYTLSILAPPDAGTLHKALYAKALKVFQRVRSGTSFGGITQKLF